MATGSFWIEVTNMWRRQGITSITSQPTIPAIWRGSAYLWSSWSWASTSLLSNTYQGFFPQD